MGIDPKIRAGFDQAAAEIADTYPPMLARFFKECIANDFTRDESLMLTRDMFDLLWTGDSRFQDGESD